MKILRDASEDEMVLTFLAGEIESNRFQEDLLAAIETCGSTPDLITKPNLASPEENSLRRKILGVFRGYPDKEIFEKYPEDIEWKYVEFEEADLDHIYYVDYSYWNELSNHTSKPLEAARNIKAGRTVFDVPNGNFVKAAAALEQGVSLPPIILVTHDKCRSMVLEGHLRVTAYAMCPGCFGGTKGYVGICGADAMYLMQPLFERLDKYEAFLNGFDFMRLGQAISHGDQNVAMMVISGMQRQVTELGLEAELASPLQGIRQCIISNDMHQALDIMAVVTAKRVGLLRRL